LSSLLSLPVVIPLVGAALVAASDHVVPDAVKEVPPMIFAAASTALSLLLLVNAHAYDLLHWHGGWTPRHGVAIGIAFVGDPFGVATAAFAGAMVTAALVYSWRYMEESPRLYRVLMLVFLAGACGFALSGDAFNIFVWFELSAVAAYALAGYMVDELGPLQGAINFAITNTIGALMVLFGIALLYGRTGALNLAQIGASLSHRAADGLVIVAFTLLVAGFLIKSALVPFHLWLADTYAVAPAPVCLVFAAVMSELGLYGIARFYWTVFSGAFHGHADAITGVLVGVGVATALVGAVMAFLQRHLKRLLAYTVISHAGVTLAGIALLDAKGLAGAANLVVSHGFLKGALFLGAGVLLRSFGDVDELRLYGRGRQLRALGVLLVAAAVGLVGLPYVGSFLGHSLVDEAASARGEAWIAPVFAFATALSTAAILRAVARIFFGIGTRDDPLLTEQPPEEAPAEEASRPLMVAVVGVLVAGGLVLSVIPGLQDRSESAAEVFRDRAAYAGRVLHGEHAYTSPVPTVLRAAKPASIVYGMSSFVAAVALTLFGLYRSRSLRLLEPPIGVLKAWHSGVAADYVVWLTVGTAIVGAVWAFTLR